MPLRMRLGLLALIAFLGSVEGKAQTASGGAEKSAWYAYFGDHPITKHWGAHLEGQYRSEGLVTGHEQLLIRPGVNYSFNKHLLGTVAYTYIRSYPSESGSLGKASGPQPEHRIHEDLKVFHSLFQHGSSRGVAFTHRLRLEQRFNGSSVIGKGTQSWQFAERFRYRVAARVPLPWNTSGWRPDYALLFGEGLWAFGPHSNGRYVSQGRASGAAGWQLTKNTQLEVGYIYQYSPRGNGVIGQNNHIFAITVNSVAPLKRLWGK